MKEDNSSFHYSCNVGECDLSMTSRSEMKSSGVGRGLPAGTPSGFNVVFWLDLGPSVGQPKHNVVATLDFGRSVTQPKPNVATTL